MMSPVDLVPPIPSKGVESTITERRLFDACMHMKAETSGPFAAPRLYGLDKYPLGNKQIGQGYAKHWVYDNSCLVFINNLKLMHDLSINLDTERHLEIDFILEGGCDIAFGNKQVPTNNLPRILISNSDSNARKTRRFISGKLVRNVCLWLPHDALFGSFGLDREVLPPSLSAILNQQETGTYALPLLPEIRTVLKDIIDMQFKGALAEKYLDAKITELLCLTSEYLNSSPRILSPNQSLPLYKVESMARAVELLTIDLANPPSVADLADTLGMSKNTLARSFRAFHGSNISEFLLKSRMEAAHALLREGTHSVQEISMRVGYESQSSFGRSYKKFFNRAPSSDAPKVIALGC